MFTWRVTHLKTRRIPYKVGSICTTAHSTWTPSPGGVSRMPTSRSYQHARRVLARSQSPMKLFISLRECWLRGIAEWSPPCGRLGIDMRSKLPKTSTNTSGTRERRGRLGGLTGPTLRTPFITPFSNYDLASITRNKHYSAGSLTYTSDTDTFDLVFAPSSFVHLSSFSFASLAS